MQTTVTMDRVIEVDPSLRMKKPYGYDISLTEKDKGEVQVRRHITGEIQHKNYLDYLGLCWDNHIGIIISPDIVWSVIANEIASHIKDNAKSYEHLFTTTPGEKQDLIIITSDPVLMPLDELVLQLSKLVPTDINLFVPDFSTTTPSTKFASYAAFADAMQVYYRYFTSKCGISKVKVLGSYEDWELLCNNIVKIKNLLTGIKQEYIDGLLHTIGNIQSNETTDFWKDIYMEKQCFSGHPDEISGWITKLYMNPPKDGDLLKFSSGVSNVPYTYLDANKHLELRYGLLSSNFEDGFLVPDFGFVVNEVIKK